MSDPNYIEDCKSLMGIFNYWILPDEENKWQDISTKPVALIIHRPNNIALLGQIGGLEATSKTSTSVNMHGNALQKALWTMAETKGTDACLKSGSPTKYYFLFKFKHRGFRQSVHQYTKLTVDAVTGDEDRTDMSLGMLHLWNPHEQHCDEVEVRRSSPSPPPSSE
jgi:hypothetical protein